MDYSRPQQLQDLNEGASNPWEGGDDALTNSKLCFFRIFDVDAENRLCSIKTFGSEPAISNAEFLDIQWLGLYSHPEGDEISYIPRLGAYGVCAFVGSRPFIIGYFNPIILDNTEEIEDKEGEGIEPVGGSAATNKEKVNAGDYIFRTFGNCRLILRAGGEIELEATKICRRTYFPARNRITEISQNLEITTDAGYMNWVHVDQDSNSEETLCTHVWKDDVGSTNIIKEERGTVEQDSDLIHRYVISPGANVNEHLSSMSEPVLVRETYNTGKTEFTINQTAYHELIMPDGTYTRDIGEKKNITEIKPTGEWHFNINQKFDHVIKDTGENIINIADKYKLNIKPTGDVSLNVADKCMVSIKATGETKIDVGPGKSTITIKPSGEVVIKTETEVTCETKTVNLKASFVKLGKAVSDVVPMGKLLVKAINLFIASYKEHTHQVPQSPAGITMSDVPIESKPTKAIVATAVLSETVKVQK